MYGAAIGFGIVICQGWPSMGSDFGGVIALLAGVLTITRDHVEAMVAHARADHPDEACGVIVGPGNPAVLAERLLTLVGDVGARTAIAGRGSCRWRPGGTLWRRT